MKILGIIILMVSQAAMAAQSSVKCDLTTGDGDIDPIRLESSVTIENGKTGVLSYQGTRYDLYVSYRTVPAPTWLISLNTKEGVINGYGSLGYLDKSNMAQIDCNLVEAE